jgi:polyhydroxyalkanoate synthesis regulator phasin
MRDAIKRYVDAAQSLTEMSRERAERVARGLAGGGFIGGDQIRDVASDLVRRSRENRERIRELVARELGKQVSRLGLATKEDLERLGRRVRALETPPATAKKTRRRPAAAKPRPAGKASATARGRRPATARSGPSRRRSAGSRRRPGSPR